MKNVSTGQVFSRFSGRLWRGFLGTFSPLLFPPVLQLLSPGTWAGQNPWCLASEANEAQALMSHCKNSVRDTVIGKRWICLDSEKHTSQGVSHHRRQVLWPWNVVWLVFSSLVKSYANEWENHPNHWGTTHSIFWQCLGTLLPPLGVSFSLQIGDQGLVEFDLSS